MKTFSFSLIKFSKKIKIFFLQDMWDVLKDYPAARVRLEAIAVKRLEKYRKEPLKKSIFFYSIMNRMNLDC